jgi:phage shock protein PspC (stress-responsive transcriptional regulator)
VAGINALWLAVLTAVLVRYFFIVPILFVVSALVIFALAWLKLKSDHP